MRKTFRRTRTSDVTTAPAPKPAFEVNHFYERVIGLRCTNPRDFDALSPAVKISLGAYEAAKREHERLQTVRDELATA